MVRNNIFFLKLVGNFLIMFLISDNVVTLHILKKNVLEHIRTGYEKIWH
jgi:hypothetical protein